MKNKAFIIGKDLKGLLKFREDIQTIQLTAIEDFHQKISGDPSAFLFIDGDQCKPDELLKINQTYPQSKIILCLSPENFQQESFTKETTAEILFKPLSSRKIEHILKYPPKSVDRPFSNFIAHSKLMKKFIVELKQVAQTESNIFITGESGTGKEEIAKLIHQNSLRSREPFIKVNCAAMPDTLIESEFFGHEKGAFTGAYFKKPGRFELANRGSLLLDEITEVPLPMQAKLLRVVQELEFERLGGVKPIKVDVRLISTSNRDMETTLQEKTFREDLFYRLNVIPLELPPLRERKEDILPLAEHFIEKTAYKNGCTSKALSQEAQEILLEYSWPGNIRELSNVIEHAMVIDKSSMITPKQLRIKKPLRPKDFFPAQAVTLEELQKQHILNTLHSYQNNRTKTAKALGISIRTLRSKLRSYCLPS